MTTQWKHRAIRGLMISGAALALGACADSISAPQASDHVKTALRASRDDGPPADPCFSGYIQINGEWVCPGGH